MSSLPIAKWRNGCGAALAQAISGLGGGSFFATDDVGRQLRLRQATEDVGGSAADASCTTRQRQPSGRKPPSPAMSFKMPACRRIHQHS